MLDNMFDLVWKKCTHDKVTLNEKSGYCPDCGEYVENHWYITRCSCCGIKHKSLVRNGKVLLQEKFCKNCGSDSYSVEELSQLDIVNINYAVVMKKTTSANKTSIMQTWIDQNSYAPIKLLPSY